MAELVDALDLGSSDESCGGSSPSARTKRYSGVCPEDLPAKPFSHQEKAGSLSTGARPQGRASITI
ncbi:hypothetical protein BRAS3843_1990007 [Bradyrhizobium sp. STM 3843]|nr:hypothetical protein BRAS3843_1990007 [Bradyrhizobium sp. STM 3843]